MKNYEKQVMNIPKFIMMMIGERNYKIRGKNLL